MKRSATLPDTVVVSVRKAVGEELKALCAADPALEFTLHAEVDTRWTKTPILVADMPPPDASGDAPFVLFSGHHDTWHYGVMDNGGANATMIEVGTPLCDTARGVAPRPADRLLVGAFAGGGIPVPPGTPTPITRSCGGGPSRT